MYKWIYASNSAILAKTPQIRNLKVIQKRKKTNILVEKQRYRKYKKLYIEIVVKLHPKRWFIIIIQVSIQAGRGHKNPKQTLWNIGSA